MSEGIHFRLTEKHFNVNKYPFHIIIFEEESLVSLWIKNLSESNLVSFGIDGIPFHSMMLINHQPVQRLKGI